MTLLLAVVPLAAACNGSGPETPKTQPLPPDLRTVMDQVAQIRGLRSPASVRVGAITRDQVQSTLEATLTEADRQSFAHMTTLYRLLGHLGPIEDYQGAYLAFAGQNLIGFYSPKQKALYVVTSDGKTVDFQSLSQLEQSTIAHELTHALQDNTFDVQSLFAKTKDDLDWSLALSAVIEGDAVNVEGTWTRQQALLPRPAKVLLAGLSLYQGASVSIERELRFPYTTGAEWVSIVRSQSGNDAIDSVLAGRRITTAEVIHSDLFDSGFTPDSVGLPDLTRSLGTGWRHEAGGAFGEFQLRNYLQLQLTALPATQAATGWRGDRYDVYTRGTDSAAAFHLRFASAGEAQEFIAAHDSFFDGAKANVTQADGHWTAVFPDGRTTIRAATTGPDVLFVIGSNRAAAEAAFAGLAGG